jgi:hypothetical protein
MEEAESVLGSAPSPEKTVAESPEEAVDEAVNEMTLVTRHLAMANESVENAVTLLEGCQDPHGRCQVPLVEAIQGQINALVETVQAEVAILQNGEANGKTNGKAGKKVAKTETDY